MSLSDNKKNSSGQQKTFLVNFHTDISVQLLWFAFNSSQDFSGFSGVGEIMAFFEDSHMREPYPRDPRILFKPWYHLWQRFFWSSCVFSNFCFKWSPVKHYKSALLVDNFFQSDDFLEDFSCGNWNSNEIGKLYSSPNHHHQKIRGNHKFFAVSFPIWTLSKEGWFSIFESFH